MSDTPKAKATAPKAAKGIQLSSDGDKDTTKPSVWDNGESPQWVIDKEKAEADFAKDPWGLTPAQQRV